MLLEHKLKTLQEFISTSTHEELVWVNGYLNGILSKQEPQDFSSPVKQTASHKITIAYGTETGNSKRLATAFAAKAKKQGFQAKLQSLEQYRFNDLSKEDHFLAVISTHGDGEPPIAAKKFYDHVHQNAINLSHLKYSVLALGDTAYPLFCKAGEDVDQQFNKLGGQRILPLHKCDVDYSSEAENWLANVLSSLQSSGTSQNIGNSVSVKKSSGKKIYEGQIISHINLNDHGSLKETNHIEIEAEGVVYQPGDSIGIVPANNDALVSKILDLFGLDSDKKIVYKNELISAVELLSKKLSILNLPARVVQKYASIVQKEIAISSIDLNELLQIHPPVNEEQSLEIIQILEPIVPRLYSISSSPSAHPNEIHITVAKNCFSKNGQVQYGLASGLLSSLRPDQPLAFYVHPNNQFRLPQEDKNLIMIGPGTGIAPFRSFIAERDATGASGKNWLFFGEQHFVSDFLYQSEILDWMQTDVLTRVNTAFSRDQNEKIYVQHKMLQHAAALYEWLQEGSYVYVCGAKHPMSEDVENTLLKIIESEGKLSSSEAYEYLEIMKDEGRYLKDVY